MDENTKQDELEVRAREMLIERGVTTDDIADLVYYLQSSYHDNLDLETCHYNVDRVLTKREVQTAILTGIQLDKLAEQNKLEQPLQKIIETDESLYGIDEIIAFSIVNVYGSIGFTNYGFSDMQNAVILALLNYH